MKSVMMDQLFKDARAIAPDLILGSHALLDPQRLQVYVIAYFPIPLFQGPAVSAFLDGL
jgi:hypothetical protein